MTDVLDWLTNAMSAAAGTVREQDLRPLTAPERPRRRHQPAWAAPVAAAAAMVLVIGLAVAALDGLFGNPPVRRAGAAARRAIAALRHDRPGHHEDRGSLDGHRQGRRGRPGDAGREYRVAGRPRSGRRGERDVLRRRVRAQGAGGADLPVPAHRGRACRGVRAGAGRRAAPRLGGGLPGGVGQRLADRGRGLLLSTIPAT